MSKMRRNAQSNQMSVSETRITISSFRTCWLWYSVFFHEVGAFNRHPKTRTIQYRANEYPILVSIRQATAGTWKPKTYRFPLSTKQYMSTYVAAERFGLTWDKEVEHLTHVESQWLDPDGNRITIQCRDPDFPIRNDEGEYLSGEARDIEMQSRERDVYEPNH
jgi:hypothetical protein